jgi:hypothetical protein
LTRALRGTQSLRVLQRVLQRGLLLLGLACSPPTGLVPPSPPAAAPASSGFDAGFRRVEAAGQGLELWLPDADGWRHDARDRRSWAATHAATRSRLLVRAWRAEDISPAPACERQMRAWRPELPSLPPEARLETRSVRLGADVAAELWSGVTKSDAAALQGYAQLVGSDGRDCLYLAYSTSAQGSDGARLIGERLGVVTRLVFERVSRLGIGERVSVPRR